MLGPFRGRRPSAAAAIGAAVVAVPLVLVAVAGHGNPVSTLLQETGTVWVASPAQGLVSLIDGSSEEVVAAVRVTVPAGGLDVTQAGASAYVTDVAAGTVARVDGATFEQSSPFVLGTPDGGTTVLTGGGAVFVVDASARTAARVQPTTLQVSETLSLAAEPGAGQSVVDDDGRLWVIDSRGGGLAWVDGERKGKVPGVDAGSTLVLVQGRPALVDVAHRRVAALDGGGPAAWDCLDVRPEDQVRLLGSRTRPEVYAAVPSTGTVVVAAVGRDDCSRVVPVAAPGGNDFGALAQSGAYLFVPNRTDGTTTVVDTRTDEKLISFDLAAPGNDVQLVAKDGLVFYNDLDSQVAGVLTLEDGSWVQGPSIQKYDPATGQSETVETPTEPGPVPGALAPTQPAGPSPTDPTPAATPAPPDPEPQATTPPDPKPPATRPKASPTTAAVPAKPATDGATAEPPAAHDLAVGTLTANPAVIGADGVTTLTAPVANTQGAHWAVTVRAQDCDYVLTTPMEAVPAGDKLVAPLGPLSSDCLGVHAVDLVLVGPSGTATTSTTLQLVADPASTPVLSGLACTPDHPLPDAAMTCTATEAVVGSRATWTWAVAAAGGGAAVLEPTVRTAGEPLVVTLPRAGRYTVTLTVRYKGSEVAATTDVASSAVVPDLTGLGVDAATAALAELGLAAGPSTEASNAAAAGIVLRSDPGAGASVVVGDTVGVVVSGGPNPPVDLLSAASGASWASGAGTLPFNGSDIDERGFVLIRTGYALEDGSGATALETHPQWVANGWIEGRYALGAPILAGDRFRSTVGFRAITAGAVTFRVLAVLPNGVRVDVGSVSDTAADGVLRSLDVDLSSVAGARSIVLRVEAGSDSKQDWAVWVAPRIAH